MDMKRFPDYPDPNKKQRLFVIALVLAIILLVIISCSKEKIFSPTDSSTTYDDIKYIFAAKCATAGCHSGDSPAASLNLETYDGVLAGSAHGPIVVPGHANKSLLYETMDWTVEPVMPATEKLDQNHIDLIKKWINDGLLKSH
jgi:hypothetical protein